LSVEGHALCPAMCAVNADDGRNLQDTAGRCQICDLTSDV
jgi:hypothetical protein